METIRTSSFSKKINDLLNPVCYAVIYESNYDILGLFRYKVVAENFIKEGKRTGLKIVRIKTK